MPWLLNLAYCLFLLLVSPVILFRMMATGKYRDGWSHKLWGALPPRTQEGTCFWLHAVSVGEVLLLQPIVKEILARRAGDPPPLYISTTTVTGLAVAREKFAPLGAVVCYCPLDFSWAVRRALARVRPDLLVLVELELWPNLILAAHRAGVPVALINGRISERSFRGYRRVRWLFAGLLNRLHILAAQNDEYARRLIDLGASPERVAVAGSVKFDHVETDRDRPATRALREAFDLKPYETVFIAGSTQSPEEEYALRAWRQLVKTHPDLRLILVPRHRERFEEVAKLVQSQGLPLLRRSLIIAKQPQPPSVKVSDAVAGTNKRQPQSATGSASAPASQPQYDTGCASAPDVSSGVAATGRPILLLDTLGELSHCWGLADIAFVGGSLTNRGGQNMIEPAGYGAAVLFGPNTQNFREVVALLLSAGAARVVQDSQELQELVGQFLADPQAAREQGRIAQQLVLTQQGATRRTVNLLDGILQNQQADAHSIGRRHAA